MSSLSFQYLYYLVLMWPHYILHTDCYCEQRPFKMRLCGGGGDMLVTPSPHNTDARTETAQPAPALINKQLCGEQRPEHSGSPRGWRGRRKTNTSGPEPSLRTSSPPWPSQKSHHPLSCPWLLWSPGNLSSNYTSSQQPALPTFRIAPSSLAMGDICWLWVGLCPLWSLLELDRLPRLLDN